MPQFTMPFLSYGSREPNIFPSITMAHIWENLEREMGTDGHGINVKFTKNHLMYVSSIFRATVQK